MGSLQSNQGSADGLKLLIWRPDLGSGQQEPKKGCCLCLLFPASPCLYIVAPVRRLEKVLVSSGGCRFYGFWFLCFVLGNRFLGD